MFSGWIKYFENGSSVSGSDNSNVSWRQTGLENLKAVSLVDVPGEMKIIGTGNFWQSDDLIVPVRIVGTFEGKKIKRRIQKQLTVLDRFIEINEVPNKSITLNIIQSNIDQKVSPSFIMIPTEWQSKWLTLEMDLSKNEYFWYISEDRI